MKQAYIFIGRSGCGKGTQAKLLIDELKKQGEDVFSLETGSKFREFIKGETYSNRLAKEITDQGGLQPEFLAVFIWAKEIVGNLKEGDILVLDGVARKILEAKLLNSVFDFLGYKRPVVIFMNVSRKWSEERMLGRGRTDDDVQEIKRRLDWYETEVEPVVEWYKGNSEYNFLDINGEQTVEEVHQEIMSKLGFT